MPGIVRGILGKPSKAEGVLQRFTPTGFRSPGATGSFNRATNTFSVTRTPAREQAIEGVRSGFLARAGEIRELRGQVRPGFGRLSQIRKEGLRTRLAGIRDTGRRVVGNIREELARRRLGGSSFQTSATAVAESEFARLGDVARFEGQEAEAGAFLQELELSNRLIVEEFDSSIAAAQTVLQELNLDTALAAGLSQVASQLMASNIQAQAEARAAQQESTDAFLAAILGIFI